jgi:hypothetical protein
VMAHEIAHLSTLTPLDRADRRTIGLL